MLLFFTYNRASSQLSSCEFIFTLWNSVLSVIFWQQETAKRLSSPTQVGDTRESCISDLSMAFLKIEEQMCQKQASPGGVMCSI